MSGLIDLVRFSLIMIGSCIWITLGCDQSSTPSSNMIQQESNRLASEQDSTPTPSPSALTPPKEEDEVYSQEELAFNKAIEQMGTLSQSENTSGSPIPTGEEEIEETDEVICTLQSFKAAESYNEHLILDPTTDVIFPGAVLKGDSILNGTYTPVTELRKPMTLSISLENLTELGTIVIDQPRLSTVREGVNQLLSQSLSGDTAASITFEIEEIHSEEQLRVALGAHYRYNGPTSVNVRGDFDFSNTETKTRMIVKFLQKYYSIDMDIPPRPSDFFLYPGKINLSSLGQTSPMFVSSVTYGRLALFSIESSHSSQEVKTALNIALSTIVHEGGLEAESESTEILNQSNIRGTILGGSAESAVQTIRGLSALQEYIENGGNYSADSPAVPMSYKLRYMSDYSIGNLILSSEYQVRNCVDQPPNSVRVKLKYLRCPSDQDAGSNGEFYGEIYAYLKGVNATSVETIGSNLLWSANKGDPAEIALGGGELLLNREVIFNYDPRDFEEGYIELSGALIEKDFLWGDDDLGADTQIVFLKEVLHASSSQGIDDSSDSLIFNGNREIVEAHFDLSLRND